MTKTIEIKPLFAAQVKGFNEAKSAIAKFNKEILDLKGEQSEVMSQLRLIKRSEKTEQGGYEVTGKTDEIVAQLNELEQKVEVLRESKKEREIVAEMYQINIDRLVSMALREKIAELPTDKKLNKRHFDKLAAAVQEITGGTVRIVKDGIIRENNLKCYYSSDDRLIHTDNTLYSVIEDDGTMGEKWKTIYQYDIINDVELNAKKVIELEKEKARLEDEMRKIERNISGYRYHNAPEEKPLNEEVK